MKVRIAPSILASDFGRLAEQVVEAEEAGVDWIHVDVMDGHFVPNITIGPAITEAVRRATRLPVDVHLMIEAPDRYIQAFADAGADYLTVHQEACPHLHRTIQRIRAAGVHPGVALNPATPVEAAAPILPDIDLLLVMSVNPGFGGQAFIPSALATLARARELLNACGGEDTALEVDGGIDATTAPGVAGAGADVLVAGIGHLRAPAGGGCRGLRDPQRRGNPRAADAVATVMAIFRRTHRLPHSPAEVFAWHMRPGALERLLPPGKTCACWRARAVSPMAARLPYATGPARCGLHGRFAIRPARRESSSGTSRCAAPSTTGCTRIASHRTEQAGA